MLVQLCRRACRRAVLYPMVVARALISTPTLSPSAGRHHPPAHTTLLSLAHHRQPRTPTPTLRPLSVWRQQHTALASSAAPNDDDGDLMDDADMKTTSTRRSFEPPKLRRGDWLCEVCWSTNFASRAACFSCGAPRAKDAPTGLDRRPTASQRDRGRNMPRREIESKPGDWTCLECGTHNFARRSDCFGCGAPRADDAVGSDFATNPRARKKPRAALLPGDWICASCGGDNFARRSECFHCRAPRTAACHTVASQTTTADGRDAHYVPSVGPNQSGVVQPGDWVCPHCNTNNFSRRTVCFGCDAPRPADAETLV